MVISRGGAHGADQEHRKRQKTGRFHLFFLLFAVAFNPQQLVADGLVGGRIGVILFQPACGIKKFSVPRFFASLFASIFASFFASGSLYSNVFGKIPRYCVAGFPIYLIITQSAWSSSESEHTDRSTLVP